METLMQGMGVTIAFDGVQAVKDVDFEVQEGEIYGIIGPNGAGKTTLLNGISGLVPLDEGEIRFEGKRISGVKKPHQITRLGIGRTFQVTRPFQGLTVRENVSVGAVFGRSRGRRERRIEDVVEDAMEFVGNRDEADTLVPDLPVSQRKRVELARALAVEPKVLLLDEVMAGLNKKEIEVVMEMVLAARERGITVVLIEHIMKVVMGLCDRIMVLNHGERVCCDEPDVVSCNEDVINAYLGHRFTQQQKEKGGLTGA